MLRVLRLSTIGKIDIPMDIVIYGNTEFSQRADNENSFENQINKEGVPLYKEVKTNGIQNRNKNHWRQPSRLHHC